MSTTSKIKLNVIIGLLLIAGIAVLVWKAPCPSDSQYIFFRVILALGTACLSAILTGTIHLESKIIRAGGACVIFLLVLKFTPDLVNTTGRCLPTAHFQVNLRDSNDATISGIRPIISLMINNTIVQERRVDSLGEAIFENIPSSFIQDGSNAAKFELKDADGYCFASNKKKVIDTIVQGTSMTFRLTLDESVCCIQGYVKDEVSAEGIDSVLITVEDNNQDTLSGKNGFYRILLPANLQQKNVTLNVSKKGYITKVQSSNTMFARQDINLKSKNSK